MPSPGINVIITIRDNELLHVARKSTILLLIFLCLFYLMIIFT